MIAMMLIFPYEEELFSSKSIPAIIREITAGGRPKLHDQLIHHAVQILRETGMVSPDLHLQVPSFDRGIVLNLRDSKIDRLLNSKHMRPILNALASDKPVKLRELAATLECNPGTVKRVLDKLQKFGLISDGQLVKEAIYTPQDPVDEIPRLEHRNAISYFLSFIRKENNLDVVMVYGDSATGRVTHNIEVLLITKLVVPVPRSHEPDIDLMTVAARAALDTASVHQPFKLELALVESFEWQSYLLISKPFISPRLYRASQGIAVHGESQPSLTKLFDQWTKISPMSETELSKAIERGVFIKTPAGFEATKSFVDVLSKASTKASEDVITVNVGAKTVSIPRLRLVKAKDVKV
jgi:hypothetical protein